MVLRTCWRCLQNRRKDLLSPPISPSLLYLRPFTTTPSLPRQTPLKATRSAAKSSPKRGERTTFRKSNKGKGDGMKGRPEPGARKAARKRIVLSNTNALDVPGIKDLYLQNAVLEDMRGHVVGISDSMVDRLRAAEAFKPTQGWSLFRKPCTLVRKETVGYGQLIGGGIERGLIENGTEEASEEQGPVTTNINKVTRRVLVGERGTGKSILVLQVMMMAFLQEWIVIHIPEGTLPLLNHLYENPLVLSH